MAGIVDQRDFGASMKPLNPSLSIGYVSPGWPLDAFPNGIVSYIADMADQLPKMGHQVTILALRTVGVEQDPGVYDVDRSFQTRSQSRLLMDRLGYRMMPRWAAHRMNSRHVLATFRPAILQRNIQLLEMEETFGSSAWVQRALSIPVCVRLHGPWFLNGPAAGCTQE